MPKKPKLKQKQRQSQKQIVNINLGKVSKPKKRGKRKTQIQKPVLYQSVNYQLSQPFTQPVQPSLIPPSVMRSSAVTESLLIPAPIIETTPIINSTPIIEDTEVQPVLVPVRPIRPIRQKFTLKTEPPAFTNVEAILEPPAFTNVEPILELPTFTNVEPILEPPYIAPLLLESEEDQPVERGLTESRGPINIPFNIESPAKTLTEELKPLPPKEKPKGYLGDEPPPPVESKKGRPKGVKNKPKEEPKKEILPLFLNPEEENPQPNILGFETTQRIIPQKKFPLKIEVQPQLKQKTFPLSQSEGQIQFLGQSPEEVSVLEKRRRRKEKEVGLERVREEPSEQPLQYGFSN